MGESLYDKKVRGTLGLFYHIIIWNEAWMKLPIGYWGVHPFVILSVRR